MFGAGWWKHDTEAADQAAGARPAWRRSDDGWYFNGELFTPEIGYLADTEQQAGRTIQVAYNQLA